MIPNTTNKLFVTEDWQKVYQSFKNADFKSYDFETLKRTMIGYLRDNYPEDFNDYIDSSEYVALIDLIAFLGQNLSFRIDLNARENFIETAQRRDSILRLAQLIGYTPKRNVPSNGFLKITAVSTTDSVFDSNGVNLANTVIGWNDSTNPEWYQQFVNIINSASTSNFGTPVDKAVISGVTTENYKFASDNQDVPLFSFNKNINGVQMNFEIVPCTFSGTDYIYEEPPTPANKFSYIYKNDNQGPGSANTGFFVHFRQGKLNVANFTVDNPVPNEIIGVNTTNINDTDIWLWQKDNANNFSQLWTKVNSASQNNNVIYNSLSKDLRTFYAVTSRENDQIDLNFSDGVFGDLPKGDFVLFYRQSNANTYVLKPENFSGVIVALPYVNSLGQSHTLQLTLSLLYTVANSSGPESNASIQLKAPQNYYLQNRMITGEDYNIAPLNAGSDILKVKSVNRISSGISRYFDIADVSGAYSKTNIFADDGILYQEEQEGLLQLTFTNRNQVLGFVKNNLSDVIASPNMKNFYIEKFSNPNLGALGIGWTEVNKVATQSRGYFTFNDLAIAVGEFSQSEMKYIVPGSLVKFTAPSGYYYDKKNNLKAGTTTPQGGRSYIWALVQQVIGDGSNNGIGQLDDGTGPVIFSTRVPQGSIPAEVIPKYPKLLGFSVENEIANICMTQKNFGLTIDNSTRAWDIILSSNLNLTQNFSLEKQGNVDDSGFDSSWLISFTWTGSYYKVRYRTLDYIFESVAQTAFHIDETSINFDYVTNKVIKDKIEVLSINTSGDGSLGFDRVWQIDSPVIEIDGYVNPKKIKVSFYDFNNTGQLDDPESFESIVKPSEIGPSGYRENFVYFKKMSDGLRYELEDASIFISLPNESFVQETDKVNGNLFYFYNEDINVVKYFDSQTASFVYTDQYFARNGRSDLKFHYLHNSGKERRIDPSKTNLIDVYMLTTGYDNDFRNYLKGVTSTAPLSPTSQDLEQNYKPYLQSIKAISDEIVFNPVKYKILFGEKADVNLQAQFKAVRNNKIVTTDNEIKTKIIEAINSFFDLNNWDFGQSFYFSELSTYIMNMLTPSIVNLVILPKNDSSFGSLYEISCLSNEILISGASVNDIEVIDAITASQLRTSSIVTSTGN
ncbi:MAG: hypothetical protein EBU90_04585 [Proteobacteria bacterium]|nr:hypothetical protein [Pseudomonadota bacterium]NBP13719.1 hypothetical protein [bacterium]